MLPFWFNVYVSPSGRNDIQDTIDGYDDYARESFSREVANLSVTPKDQWQAPHAKKLTNEDPLYEIIYMANRCQTRAIGYFEKAGGAFTIVAICTHKGKVYDPPNIFKSAHKRIKKLEQGCATTVSLKINGENFPPNGEQQYRT